MSANKKIILFKVSIANRVDDDVKCVLLACDSTDLNHINYIYDIAPYYIDLCEFSDEYIINIEKIKPVNISSTAKNSDYIDSIFN